MQHCEKRHLDNEIHSNPAGQGSRYLLTLYFREVSKCRVLKPQEELMMIKALEKLEIELWAHLLRYHKIQNFLISALKSCFDQHLQGELGPFLNECWMTLIAGARGRLTARQIKKGAALLRRLDVDHILINQVFMKLREIIQGNHEHLKRSFLNTEEARRTFFSFYQQARALAELAEAKRQEFVLANLRLVIMVARRLNLRYMPLQDLIQEGNIGLLKAVGRYNYRRGYRFSTYATWWIRHAITRAIDQKAHLLRVPVHKLAAYHQVNSVARQLGQKLGRQPTSAEIGKWLNVGADKIEAVESWVPNNPLPLDSFLQDEASANSIFTDSNSTKAAECLLNKQILEQVRMMMNDLKPIEQDVIQSRFGLNGHDEHTLEEISQRYSLSRERIRQIQEQALQKLRKALIQKKAI